MRFSRFGPWSILFPATLLMATMVVGSISPDALTAQAQDEEDEPHPAHIHTGSCETLGDIAFPLNDVAYDGMAMGNTAMGGTPAADMAMGETVGSSSAVPLETSVTLVDAPLEQIADGQHAINLHLSAEEIDSYIACGDIGGQMMGDMLVIGLGELNESEEVGFAVLEGMGDQTRVALFLMDQEAQAPEEPAEASPAA
jgi:hypothetical protein